MTRLDKKRIEEMRDHLVGKKVRSFRYEQGVDYFVLTFVDDKGENEMEISFRLMADLVQ